jgi:hypothetical protein
MQEQAFRACLTSQIKTQCPDIFHSRIEGLSVFQRPRRSGQQLPLGVLLLESFTDPFLGLGTTAAKGIHPTL